MAGFESLKESLEKSWRRSPIKGAVLAVKVEEVLKDLLPEEASLVSFKEGKLVLGAPSSAAASDLYLKSRQIKLAINQKLEGKVVEKVRYRILDKAQKD